MVDVLRLRSFGAGQDLVDRTFAAVDDPEALTWSECRDVFDAVGGPFSYGLAEHLGPHGWETVDVVHDLVPLQEAWRREFGPLPDAPTVHQAVALAAIERLRPRVVIDLNLKVFSTADLRRIRQRFPFVERTIGQINTIKRLDRAFGHDLVLTPSRPLIALLERAGGPRARIFHHAFDPTRSGVVVDGPRDGVVFTGSIGKGRYSERARILAGLLEDGLVEAWVSEGKAGSIPARPSSLRVPRSRGDVLSMLPLPLHARVVGATDRGSVSLDDRLRGDPSLVPMNPPGDDGYPYVGLSAAFPDRCHPPVFAGAMFDLLGRARATVDHTIETASTALRHFEATGMETALITNTIDGLGEVFALGTEVLAYDGAAEARELVTWLADDAAAAAAIGAAGRARTLRDHTVAKRSEELAVVLDELLAA